jgi:hypothetical protein
MPKRIDRSPAETDSDGYFTRINIRALNERIDAGYFDSALAILRVS